MKKNNNVVFEQVLHKPSCTSTEDGWRLEILDLESKGIVLSQFTAKLIFTFVLHMQIAGFLMTWLICLCSVDNFITTNF